MKARALTPLDRVLVEIERALGSALDSRPIAQRPSPAEGIEDTVLSDEERRHAGGLMRINHVGEVCAQALYSGQAAVARNEALRSQLLEAAAEETDHLAWCGERLDELGDRPSLLNPLWYGGAYAIGAVAGLIGDSLSLGFVVETERQVEAHLDDHLDRLPLADRRSRAILETMQREEIEHGQHALDRGAVELAAPVRRVMGFCADVMRFVAYRI